MMLSEYKNFNYSICTSKFVHVLEHVTTLIFQILRYKMVSLIFRTNLCSDSLIIVTESIKNKLSIMLKCQ